MRILRPTPRRIAVLLAATIGIGLGAGYAATLSFGSWHLWAGSQTLTKGTCTLGASATTDTYVNQASPNSSSGSSSASIVVRQSTASSDEWGFIRFDLSSCNIPTTGGADSATLTLYVSGAPASSRSIAVTPVLTTWSNALTWNTAQPLSYGSTTTTLTTGTTTGAKTATVTVDVDNLIKSSTANFGWRLVDGGGTNATTTFVSSSGTSSQRPQLVINYEK